MLLEKNKKIDLSFNCIIMILQAMICNENFKTNKGVTGC